MSRALAYETHEEWIAARRLSVGGSDSAALFGINPYKSEYELWAEKSGLLEPSRLESEALYWGKALEPVIADRYAQETGRELIDHGRFTIYRDGYMSCTPDREVAGDTRGPGLLSIKNVTQFKASDWAIEPPVYYQIQLQHELAVMGAPWGSFAVLIGGNRFHWLDVERNEAFIEELRSRVAEFQRRVVETDPPPVDSSRRTSEALAKLYAAENGETVRLQQDASIVDAELQAIKRSIKDLEAQRDERENQLRALIGSASAALLADGTVYTLKTVTRKGYTVADSTFRQLRRRGTK